MASALVQAVLSCCLILAGSFVTVSDKLQFQTCAPGFDYCEGDSESFSFLSLSSITLIILYKRLRRIGT